MYDSKDSLKVTKTHTSLTSSIPKREIYYGTCPYLQTTCRKSKYILDHDYYLLEINVYNLCKQSLNVDTHMLMIVVMALLINTNLTTLKRPFLCYYKNDNYYVISQKNEEHEVSRLNRFGTWRKCKYLGCLIDTKEDMKRRKSLSIESIKTLKSILVTSKYL